MQQVQLASKLACLLRIALECMKETQCTYKQQDGMFSSYKLLMVCMSVCKVCAFCKDGQHESVIEFIT